MTNDTQPPSSPTPDLNPDAPDSERVVPDAAAQRWSIMLLASHIAPGVIASYGTRMPAAQIAAEAVDIAREIVARVRGLP